MIIRRVLLLFFVPALANCFAAGQIRESAGGYEIKTDGLALLLDREDGSFRMVERLSSSGRDEGGHLSFYDFSSKNLLDKGRVSGFVKSGNTLRFRWTDRDGLLNVDNLVTAHSGHISWKVEPSVGNKGNALFLDLGIRMNLSLPGQYTYWDGNTKVNSPKAKHTRNKWLGTFPMVCAYDGTSGIAVGNAAYDLLSYLENSISPGEKGCLIDYKTRMVVDSKAKDSVTIILYGFESKYGGFRGALQKYYDIYPEYFFPHPHINPRVNLGSMQNATWSSGRKDYRPARLEYIRRLYGAWAWAYAPFKRTGDIYGEKELWDYKPAREIPEYFSKSLSWEEFHRFRRERFALLDGEVINLFYVCPQWCEQQLVNERFPDARITPDMDPDVVTAYNQPWVTGNDNEYKIFPYETSYEPFIREGMRKVAEEVDCYGWSWDCANDIGKYRGPALRDCRGRAFDEKGAYVDISIAFAELMEYAGSLKNINGKYNMGIIGNLDWCCFPSSFRLDAAIYENPPYYIPERVESVRYSIGHKSLSWWLDYKVDTLVDWESMSPEEIKEVFLLARDNLLLASFQWGGIPPYTFLNGVPRLFEYMPVLLEAVTTGWEPVVPVSLADGLVLSRYGRDVKTILCFGNPGDASVKTSVTVENRFLGDFAYVFVPHTGQETLQEIDGAYTVLKETVVPGRTPLILKAQLGFIPRGRVTASVKSEEDAFVSKTSIIIDAENAFATKMVAREETGKKISSVTVNGKNLKFAGDSDGKVVFDARLSPGNNTVVVTRYSTTFLSSEKEMLEFPALAGKEKPGCIIVFTAEDNESEKLALRIQDYFRYYGEAVPPHVKIEVPAISDTGGLKSGNLIIVDVGGKNALARALKLKYRGEASASILDRGEAGKVLYLGGRDHESVQDAMLKLMRLWDKKYTFYGRFPDTTYLYMYQRPDGNFAAKKAGLVGKLLE